MELSEVSLLTKLKRLEGLIGSVKITGWEDKFLSSLVPAAIDRANHGNVIRLTDKQQQVVDQLFEDNFAS